MSDDVQRYDAHTADGRVVTIEVREMATGRWSATYNGWFGVASSINGAIDDLARRIGLVPHEIVPHGTPPRAELIAALRSLCDDVQYAFADGNTACHACGVNNGCAPHCTALAARRLLAATEVR